MAFTPIPLFSDNDGADSTKLNNIISNLNHLEQSRLRVSYNAFGTTKVDGIKLACGATDINAPTAEFRTRWVFTGNFFTTGSRPVAVVTHGSLRNRWSTTAVAQRTGESPILDHTGFQCYFRAVTPGTKMSGPNYLYWIMMGY
jgi:hypothetical protein